MIIDNEKDRYPDDGYKIKTVWDFIKTFAGVSINNPADSPKGKLDIVTGYFTVRALSTLNRKLPKEDVFRIVSSEMVTPEDDTNHIIDLLQGDGSIESSINLSQCAEEAKAFLERNNVYIKAITNAFCHAKAYMFKNNKLHGDNFYLMGSSNLTDAGLGLKVSPNVELNMGTTSKLHDSNYDEVCSWFKDIWERSDDKIHSDPDDDKSPLITVKEYFIRQIEEYFRKYTPEEIYYKILYELFRSDIELDSDISRSKDMSDLRTSIIWKTLFNYQQKGVISLVKMLQKYNGAILADAVGLGKTFSALAVIKYYQEKGYFCVVLCPKKLENNWTQYLRRHGSRFEKDEFDYVVRFHTDLQNDRLRNYTDANLQYIQSRRKVLIVIDESHNLRNEKSNRYQDLMANVIKNQPGVENRDVKVLMLSATPINTGLNDVKGQFDLIGHGDDRAFDNEDFGVESLKNLFTDAQRKYSQWCNDKNRTIGGFIATLSPKFFNLTDKLIVARTRSLIEKTLGENLGFPEKDKPINIYQGVDHFGKYNTTEEIYDAFESLFLTAYQPSLFLSESRKKAKKEAAANWEDDVNRERFLVKMMGILFMKRLESSWYSCKSTVQKVLDVHERTLQMVIDFENKHSDGSLDISTDGLDDEEEEEIDELYSLRKGTINLAEMKNLGGFKRGLQQDVNKLKEIVNGLKDFEEKYNKGQERDLKLDELEIILKEKQRSKNHKVVVFTAFTDTAEFIYTELLKRGFTNMAMVSGQLIKTTGNHSTTHFTDVLQSFAPYSKLYEELDWSDLYIQAKLDRSKYYNDDKGRWEVDYDLWNQLIKRYRPDVLRKLDDRIDILIATDCLSEGQNLQDADMEINYDIHWNPVRLIQRFGRIDRIGSPNKTIRCVNFWPAKSFEEYLRLEDRIMNRMAIMNLAGSETPDLNTKYEQMVEDNPLVDKNADRLLSELQNNSISDIESPRTLSLKDFSFEVFRQDLLDYLERNREVFYHMPNGIYSGFKLSDVADADIPESLVAVIGYPCRHGDTKKKYQEIYLMCQPVDPHQPTTYHEFNRSEVLQLLRTHKTAPRFVPDWIEHNDSDKLQRLSSVMREWMQEQVPQEAVTNLEDIFKSKRSIPAKAKKSVKLEDKFKLENFDLIVWEYLCKSKQ